MPKSTAPTTIADYREAYREAMGFDPISLVYIDGMFRFHGTGLSYSKRDILAMTDRLRVEKRKREAER